MKLDTNKTNLRVLDTMVPVREPQTVVELADFLQSGLNTTPTRARAVMLLSRRVGSGTPACATLFWPRLTRKFDAT